ncbi:MAG: rhodanese-like domain-containing protein [Actinomycetia bacterium]|nr:rhodanese-like domain-containing protein [Actinomycetes bacterium]
MTCQDLSLDDAWRMLVATPSAVVIDVRTKAEWAYVGTPELASVGNELRLVEWIDYPGGQPNPRFVEEASAGLDPSQDVLLLCRSGVRSRAAGEALLSTGFTNVYNIATGFEGGLDSEGHRHGGWKENLPWRQS